MKHIVLLMMLMALTACGKMNVKPDNTFVIVHPDPVPTLQLDSPHFTVANQSELKVIATDPSKANEVWYILDESQFKLMMGNLIGISDNLAKSKLNNEYYYKSIEDYKKKSP